MSDDDDPGPDETLFGPEDEQESISAAVFLDRDDDASVDRIGRTWLEAATALFPELWDAALSGDAGARGQMWCTRRDGPIAIKPLHPIRWAAALDDLASRPESAGFTLFTRQVDVTAKVKGGDMLGGLYLTALGPIPKTQTECARWTDFVAAALNDANPAYGDMGGAGSAGNDYGAVLDDALRRKRRDSEAQAREVLRGYSWVTVVPQELVDKLGGVESIVASGAVHNVVPLDAGGAILQATPTVREFTGAPVHKLFELLAPILPPGQPKVPRGYLGPEHYTLVWEDASIAAQRRTNK